MTMHPRTFFLRSALLITTSAAGGICAAGCTQDAPGRYANPSTSTYATSKDPSFAQNQDDQYGGWDFIAQALKKDGIPDKLLKEVYRGDTLPRFDFVPFKLAPQETHDMYQSYRTEQIQVVMRQCYDQFKPEFDGASRRYNVPQSVLLAIIVVESRCGIRTGNELIVNRLSRVASVLDVNNVKRNFEELKNAPDGDTVTYEQVVARAHYLFDTFYPQLLALFNQHVAGNLDVFSLRGSGAGAFGWPQFLPLTYQTFGVDGDHSGKVSLFEPADAIFSVGNFFQSNGWKNSLSVEEKKSVIWHYNHSTPYIDTILYLADGFE